MKKIFYYFVLIMMLNGCGLYKTPKVEPIATPQDFKENLRINNHNLQTQWWKNFHDTNLNHLVNKAIQNNLRYQVALSNIKVSRTYVSESMINRLINLNVGYNADRFSFTNNSIGVANFNTPTRPININFHNLYASAGYEMDIWNKRNNSSKRAKLSVRIREAESKAVQLALISEVVNSYFQIATLNGLVDNLNKQRNIANKSINILKVQHQNGFINTNLVNTAKSNRDQIDNSINNLKKQRKIYMNNLAYLLGEYSEQFNYPIKSMLPRTNFHALLPPAIPAEMLGNRPDVQKTFMEIMSYGYLKQEVLANFLPDIPIYASINNEGAVLGLLSQSSALIIYGFSVTERLTSAAKNLGEYKRTKEYYQQAILNYRDTVLNAFQEVNNALLSYNEDYKNLNLQKNILNNTAAQLKIAHQQYKSGAIDYNTYLQFELSLQQSNYNIEVQKMYLYQDVIQIYKTLGLGANGSCKDKKIVVCPTPTPKKAVTAAAGKIEIVKKSSVKVAAPKKVNYQHTIIQKPIIKAKTSQYTIQLAANHGIKNIRYLQHNKRLFVDKTNVRRLTNANGNWYVLTMGEYTSVSQAREKIKTLPAPLAKLHPWIRAIHDFKN